MDSKLGTITFTYTLKENSAYSGDIEKTVETFTSSLREMGIAEEPSFDCAGGPSARGVMTLQTLHRGEELLDAKRKAAISVMVTKFGNIGLNGNFIVKGGPRLAGQER